MSEWSEEDEDGALENQVTAVRDRLPWSYRLAEVRGNHRKGCSECGYDAWLPGEYYVFNHIKPWGTNKYCLNCAETAEFSDDDDDDPVMRLRRGAFFEFQAPRSMPRTVPPLPFYLLDQLHAPTPTQRTTTTTKRERETLPPVSAPDDTNKRRRETP